MLEGGTKREEQRKEKEYRGREKKRDKESGRERKREDWRE